MDLPIRKRKCCYNSIDLFALGGSGLNFCIEVRDGTSGWEKASNFDALMHIDEDFLNEKFTQPECGRQANNLTDSSPG